MTTQANVHFPDKKKHRLSMINLELKAIQLSNMPMLLSTTTKQKQIKLKAFLTFWSVIVICDNKQARPDINSESKGLWLTTTIWLSCKKQHIIFVEHFKTAELSQHCETL